MRKKEKSSFLLFFFCIRLTKTRVWYWIFSTEHWLLNRQSVCRAQSGNDPARRRGEHAAPSMWLNRSLNAVLPSPLHLIIMEAICCPYLNSFKKNKISALDGAPHQYCTYNSAFKRGMRAPTLGNLWQPVTPTSKICSCHRLGWRKNKAQSAEEQSVLLGVPVLSLHKAWSKSHPGAALLRRGPQRSLKRSSSELVPYGVTQWAPRRPSWATGWRASTAHRIANAPFAHSLS